MGLGIKQESYFIKSNSMKKELEKMFCLPDVLTIEKVEDKKNGIVVLTCSTKKRKEHCRHCFKEHFISFLEKEIK